MAQKSKTQKAKASAARQARKAAKAEVEENGSVQASEGAKAAESKDIKKAEPKKVEVKKDKPKKERFKFIKEVRSEMRRVTWPTRTEVIRWTGVVVGALVFFGVYVAVLDNLIVTPIVVAISGLGA